jgi:uncharacterized protein YciI
MRTLFLVHRKGGPAWDAAKPLRSQAQWTEHAAFMDQLAADGFVLLGGPVGDAGKVLLIVDAAGEDQVNSTLARDPWTQSGMLTHEIERWTVLLESPVGIALRKSVSR